jgi:hypothetical protein
LDLKHIVYDARNHELEISTVGKNSAQLMRRTAALAPLPSSSEIKHSNSRRRRRHHHHHHHHQLACLSTGP